MTTKLEHSQFKQLETPVINSPLKTAREAVREIIAVLCWTYFLIKVFMFDLDSFLIKTYLPKYGWVISYKFFIIIGLIAIFFIITKETRILNWLAYIFFYPFIAFFWKIPAFIIAHKSWNLAFAIINSIISFFRSFKYRFIRVSIFLISIILICTSTEKIILWCSIISILLILFLSYIRRFILIFKPSSIFQVHAKFFFKIRIYGKNTFGLDEEMKTVALESLSHQQLEKRTTNLQMSVLYNRLCFFVAKKMKDFQRSGFNIVSYVITILSLIFYTIFAFAFIYLGIYHLDPTAFHVIRTPHFFQFLYFSFNNLFSNTIAEVSAGIPLSQTVVMIQQFFYIFLGVILVSVFFSFKQQKHSEELDTIIDNIKQEGKEMELFIKDEYKINNIEDAIAELEKLKSNLFNLIFKLSNYIK